MLLCRGEAHHCGLWGAGSERWPVVRKVGARRGVGFTVGDITPRTETGTRIDPGLFRSAGKDGRRVTSDRGRLRKLETHGSLLGSTSRSRAARMAFTMRPETFA